MKTSNIIITATIVLITGCYFFDSIKLRSKYFSTDFSDPYYDCTKIEIPPTNTVIIDTTLYKGFSSLTIVYGNKNQIITRDARQFSYRYTDTGLYISNKHWKNKLFIMLKELEEVKSKKSHIKIKDFKINSLKLNLENEAYANINKCIIQDLSVDCIHANVYLDSITTVHNLNLRLQSESSFSMYNIPSGNFNYEVKDSSNISLYGKAIGLIKRE